MCAQPMIVTPLHLPMPSSAAIIPSRGQSLCHSWNQLGGHAATGGLGPTLFGAAPSRTQQESQDGYVNRWLTDTTSQTRARSVPAARHPLERATAPVSLNQYRTPDSEQQLFNQSASYSTDVRPPFDRGPRSLSPETGGRQVRALAKGAMDGIEEAQIASYLQIPMSINHSRGSLAEFAAQITCLFWFEDTSTLLRVENSPTPPNIIPLPTEANPTVGFRKWVTTLLSTTQVSQNVILLALLFVYRLKKITMNVKGKTGSEYRLLTVALMLGNKFLDDNTYTNRTWADVSGISVSEIHVMEVEFLSNMKYDLYTAAEQWSEWHILLGRFADYFEKAGRAYSAVPTPLSMTASQLGGQPALPFTPPSEQLSPPHLAAQRMSTPQRQLPNPLPIYNMTTGIPQPAPRLTEDLRSCDLRAAGSRPASRKRSFDNPIFSMPQKQARTTHQNLHESSTMIYPSAISPQNAVPRLPLPTNSIPPSVIPAPMYAPSYPTTLPSSNIQLPLPALSTMPAPAPLPSLLTQTQPISRPEVQDISPTNTNFAGPPASAHSPSGYLMYRNSPYRPVRQVNTLLAPPPAVPALQSPLQHMSRQPTFYQPLSKGPIEPRQGMVPYLTPRQFQIPPVDPTRQAPSLDYRQFLGYR